MSIWRLKIQKMSYDAMEVYGSLKGFAVNFILF